MSDLTQENVAWDGSGDPNETQKQGHQGTLVETPPPEEGAGELQPQPMSDESSGGENNG